MSVPDKGKKENVLVGSLSALVRMFVCTCAGSNKDRIQINSKPPVSLIPQFIVGLLKKTTVCLEWPNDPQN